MIEDFLQLIKPGVTVKNPEKGIYSVLEQTEKLNSYDGLFGDFYDIVACHPVYNRIMWGYSSAKFQEKLREILSMGDGPILDAGCGSLAFTYKVYRGFNKRPVVFLDQSLKLLRKAKNRLSHKNEVPGTFLILQGDAFELPFIEKSFDTIVAMNLLHVLPDLDPFLSALTRMAKPDSEILFTTLVLNDRFGDSVLHKWDSAGELTARKPEDLGQTFQKHNLDPQFELMGNVAFIRCSL
jgi:ubiquinone/menaquinone biosynthesis C-methylase UbiE